MITTALLFPILAAAVAVTPQDEANDRWLVFGTQDGIAKLFEFDPGKKALVERVEFGPSPWAPDLLFWKGDGPGDLLRWQRRLPGVRGHRVEVYHWNPKNDSLRHLGRRKTVWGLGAGNAGVFVHTRLGVEIVDYEKGELRAPKPSFRFLRDLGPRWLVQRQEERDTQKARLFDPETGAFGAPFALPGKVRVEKHGVDATWIGANADGSALGFVDPIPVRQAPPFGEAPRIVEVAYHVLGLRNATEHSGSIRVLVVGGSGIAVLPMSMEAAFDSRGRLTLANVVADQKAEKLGDGVLKNWITLRPPNWELSTSRKRPDVLVQQGSKSPIRYLPPYLEATAAEIRKPSDLLYAICKRKKLPTPFRKEVGGRVQESYVPMAFSQDGRRFLARLRIPERKADLLYFDLEKDELVGIPAPGLKIPNLRCVPAKR